MRRSTIEERFTHFVAEPTLERYLAVRELIQSAPEYDPYGGELEAIGLLFDAGDLAQVLRACDALGCGWCLSPRVHFWAGVSALELGDSARGQREKRCVQACLQGLLATGHGTAANPFQVTYLSDEYDLLRSLSAADVLGQELLDTGICQCDVIRCRDGREYWFDVTPFLASPRSTTAAPTPDRSRRPMARPV